MSILFSDSNWLLIFDFISYVEDKPVLEKCIFTIILAHRFNDELIEFLFPWCLCTQLFLMLDKTACARSVDNKYIWKNAN